MGRTLCVDVPVASLPEVHHHAGGIVEAGVEDLVDGVHGPVLAKALQTEGPQSRAGDRVGVHRAPEAEEGRQIGGLLAQPLDAVGGGVCVGEDRRESQRVADLVVGPAIPLPVEVGGCR